MYKYLHLVTVGTSIIRNAYRLAGEYSILEKHADRLEKWSRAEPDSYWDKDAGEHARVSSEVFNDVLAFVASDPRRASAELNSLLSYLEYLSRRGIKGVVHDIVLYSTDTGTSLFSAKIVKKYLNTYRAEKVASEGHVIGEIEVEVIEWFGKDFWRGLLNLVEKISRKIIYSGESYDRILVNLTAGFKPESSFLLMASSIFGINTAYYIHEYMRHVVEIPVIELQLTEGMRKILEHLKSAGDRALPQSIARVTDKLGLSVNGKPLPEAVKLAKILLRYR